MKRTDVMMGKGCYIYTNKWLFSERKPFISTNFLNKAEKMPVMDNCTEDLQNLFACMKKYAFDDLPCGQFHDAYLRCVRKSTTERTRIKEIYKDAPLGEEIGGKKGLTVGQLNKIMKLYPQPGLGKRPFHVKARLPSQPYYADLFNAKHKAGKQG